MSCTLLVLLPAGAWRLSAQTPSKRQVYVTVTDPQSRLVTGLDQGHFQVIEQGAPRTITGFSDGAYPIALAIVSDAPVAIGSLGLADELFQTSSLPDAVRQLAASQHDRKAIVTTSSENLPAAPPGLRVLQADPANLPKAVLALRNQYRLEFESSEPSADVVVTLRRPVGLPPLTPVWK